MQIGCTIAALVCGSVLLGVGIWGEIVVLHEYDGHTVGQITNMAQQLSGQCLFTYQFTLDKMYTGVYADKCMSGYIKSVIYPVNIRYKIKDPSGNFVESQGSSVQLWPIPLMVIGGTLLLVGIVMFVVIVYEHARKKKELNVV